MTSMNFIGLDIHKKTISYCVKDISGKVQSEGKIPATRQGLRKWVGTLSKPWTVAMEATMFTGWIYDYLRPHAAAVKVAHPLMLRAIAVAKKKNDRIDAGRIADCLRCDFLPECYMAPMEIRQRRRTLRYRKLLVGQNVQLKNKIAQLLMESGVSYNKEKLHQQGYFHQVLPANPEIDPSLWPLLKLTREMIERTQKAERALLRSLEADPLLATRVERLMTIPAIGHVTALTWVLEVGEVERFHSVKQVISYCGLCSGEKTSADSDNIKNFGGDPDRVMIYGQSGGGSKVTTLMGMPSTAGLFHCASAQSGGGGNIPTKDQQKEVARVMMKDFGLAANDIQSLQKMEWAKLMAAGNAAVAKINPSGPPVAGPGAPGAPRVGWSPCVDGTVINMRSFFDAAPEISKNVPMLIGSVSEEGNRMSSKPNEEEWHASLTRSYGTEKATAIIATLKKAYPQKKIQTLSYMCGGGFGLNGLTMRNNVVKMARLKHELKAAPAYAYYFTWQTPILDGLPGAWHTAELQFCFDNTKRCEQGTGNTPEAQALARKMASSWATFAATGKPSIPGLNWEPTDPESNRTMAWDVQCRMVDDPDGEARKIILA